MSTSHSGPHSVVILVAFDSSGKELFREEVSYDDYYDGEPPIIDSEVYRSQHGIYRINGEVYNSDGQLQQSFENNYDAQGEYVHGRAVHADGTVIER